MSEQLTKEGPQKIDRPIDGQRIMFRLAKDPLRTYFAVAIKYGAYAPLKLWHGWKDERFRNQQHWSRIVTDFEVAGVATWSSHTYNRLMPEHGKLVQIERTVNIGRDELELARWSRDGRQFIVNLGTCDKEGCLTDHEVWYGLDEIHFWQPTEE